MMRIGFGQCHMNMATSKIQRILLIDRGSYTQALSASSAIYDKSVTFSAAFPSAPSVVVSISDVGRGGTVPKTAVGAMAVTETGFVCRVKSDSVVEGDITVSWVAIL